MEYIDYKELKKKQAVELNKLLGQYRDRLRELCFKDANKQLKNVREIRQVRRLIAQISALINEANLFNK